MKKQNGFTLVEIVITLSVLAILACIAIPTLRAAVQRANDGAAISALRVISQAQNQKYLSTGRYYSLNELVDDHFIDKRFIESDPATEEAVYAGYLYKITILSPPDEMVAPNYVLSVKPKTTNILMRTGSQRCGIDNQSVILCDRSDLENHFLTAADLNLAGPLSDN